MARVQWGTVSIAEIPQYTDDEAQAIWYDNQELEKIASHMWDTVNNKNEHEEEELCTRGLEDMTIKGTMERLVAKYSLDLAVLEEQKNQRDKGIRDEEALARASRAESELHVHKAVEYGKRDQESAFKYHYIKPVQEPSTTKPSSADTGRQPWFRRRSCKGRECTGTRHPRVELGRSVRRIFGMKR
jgi:hypothetical protein